MTGDRIPIRALRDEIMLFAEGEFEPFSKAVIVALVELAEAARIYLRGTAGDPTRKQLQDALARFDFGEHDPVLEQEC